MRVLLDTAAFIHAAKTPEHLGGRALAIIEDPDSLLELSSISVVEIAIKSTLGKIAFTADLTREALGRLNVRILPYKAEHGFEIFNLPRHHRDPFDRQIISQALAEGIAVITPDNSFRLYAGVKVIW
jgi:PIN domain nuclease of toxin-antitoxin system